MKNTIEFHTILKTTFFGLILLLIGLYSLFQARYLIIGPEIRLTIEPEVRNNDLKITLKGTAFNISRLWLNDRQIYTNEQGVFEEALILENGYTVATIRAEDRYDRTTEITRSFVYSPVSFIQ